MFVRLSRSCHVVSGLLTSRSFSAKSWLRVSPAVARALRDGAPVVALETAIVTHGLPRPTNLETALALEAEVREEGAEPATIALLDGKVCVGLSEDELRHLASHPSPQKVSRRDMARLLADPNAVGGTTVSGTLVAASAAGIPVFATGGIGGVHRGASDTWDVSADLQELGRSPVCVVCSGAKSILDIPKTLEVLETHGVSVLTLCSDFFPAFFAPSSGVPSPARVESPGAAAKVLASLLEASLRSGMLLAVPIPQDAAEVEDAIQEALRAAAAAGVSGRDVTPFVLQRVAEITAGTSLQANVALVRNNAKTAAQLARELSRLRTRSPASPSPSPPEPTKAKILVVGGSNVDVVCNASSDAPLTSLAALAASYPGVVRQACGGVGRNIAEVVARLGVPHRLLTAIGADSGGLFLRSACPQLNWEGALERRDLRTAHYVALLTGAGELLFGIADMAIHDAIDAAYLRSQADHMAGAAVVSCDANASVSTLREVARLCSAVAVPLWFDATDVLKATKLLDVESPSICVSVNLAELSAMLRDARVAGDSHEEGWVERLEACRDGRERLQEVRRLMRRCDRLAPFVKELLVKLGQHGSLLWPHGIWCAAPEVRNIVSVSGAGDSFLGAFLAARYAGGQGPEISLWAGMRAAQASLATHLPVSELLQGNDFDAQELEAWSKHLEREKL